MGQADKMGCGVACLAMLTHDRYWRVARHFENTHLWDEGVNLELLELYLADKGYAVRWLRWKKGRKWPPKPFADAHLVIVTDHPDAGAMGHSVVWLRNGVVLDPADPAPRKLGDYFAVKEVMGVVRLD